MCKNVSLETTVSFTNCTWDSWTHWLSKALLLVHWHTHTHTHNTKADMDCRYSWLVKLFYTFFFVFWKKDLWCLNCHLRTLTMKSRACLLALLLEICCCFICLLLFLAEDREVWWQQELNQSENSPTILNFILISKGSIYKKRL